MQTINTVFERELRKEIEIAIEELEVTVIGGHGIENFEQYRHKIGQIAGLRKALGLCEEVNDELSKR